MATRPQPNLSKEMTADGSVKDVPGIVWSLDISAIGATAGDIVAIRDGGANGSVVKKIRIPAANGLWSVPCGRYGVRCDTNIYYTEQAAAPAKIFTSVNYD